MAGVCGPRCRPAQKGLPSTHCREEEQELTSLCPAPRWGIHLSNSFNPAYEGHINLI